MQNRRFWRFLAACLVLCWTRSAWG